MRRMTFLIASLIVSGVFLWLALRDVDLEQVMARIRQADPAWVVLAVALVALSIWLRAIRWRGLLDFRMPLRQAFYILCVTFLVNQLPLRAGEIARSLLATRSGIPVVTAATSIVLERLLDTLFVVVSLAFALSRLPDAVPAATQVTTLFGLAGVASFILLIAFSRYPTFAHRVIDGLERRVTFLRRLSLHTMLDHVIDGLRPLTEWRSAIHAIGWTLISWAASFVTFYALERALNVQDVDLALTSVLGVSLASFSIAIPVSVAAIGPFELAVKVAGEAVRMNEAVATSLGFLFHGVTILSYGLLGGISLLALGVSLGDVIAPKKPAGAVETPAD